MWVSEIREDFTANSTLSCGSDAYPTAKYEWNAIRGSGFINGDVFVVSSSGFFNVSCTAYNFLRHPDDECIGETLYTAGYLPFQCMCCFIRIRVAVGLRTGNINDGSVTDIENHGHGYAKLNCTVAMSFHSA